MINIALFLIAVIVQGPPAAPQVANRPVSPPKKIIGEIATGELQNVAPTLNGRRIYYGTETDELWLYDVASQRSTKIAADVFLVPTSVSAQGNRIAFLRSADGGSTARAIWTMPLNPKTGLTAGPARRASVGNGGSPSLSPDGKWIAFESGGKNLASDCGWSSAYLAAPKCDRKNLVVMPSDGGTERVLLGGIVFIDYIRWSPDQQWLYFGAALQGSTRPGVFPMRIAVDGEKPEMIAADQFLYYDVEQGLSPDGRFIGFTETASTSGARVLVLMDLRGKAIARLPWADMWLSSTELLSWASHRVKPLKSISLVDGKVREVLPAAYAIGTPAWAPDGRRFAVLSNWQRGVGHIDSSVLLIANADGSELRTIPVPASEGRLVWSPDGRWIAMTERPWFGAQFQLFGLGVTAVDVASGRTQRLRTAVSQDIANLRWTSDSKHVLYDYSPSDGPSVGNPRVFRPVIRQVGLDGSDVVVRALPSGGGGGPSLAFISDTSVMVSDDSTTYVRSLTNDRFVVLWQGRRQASSASERGDLIAVTAPPDTAERTTRTADILTSAGVHVAKVTFPTSLLRVASGSFLFTPDNKSLLAWGRNEAANGCCVLYLAPLDGGPVRTITEFANSQGVPPFALSPDGKTVLFPPSGSTWMTLSSVDVSGFLRGAPKK